MNHRLNGTGQIGLRNFSLDLAFNIKGPEREHPLFFIGAQ